MGSPKRISVSPGDLFSFFARRYLDTQGRDVKTSRKMCIVKMVVS